MIAPQFSLSKSIRPLISATALKMMGLVDSMLGIYLLKPSK